MITALIVIGGILLLVFAAVIGLITWILVRDERGDPFAAAAPGHPAEGFGLPELLPPPDENPWWQQDTDAPGRPPPDEPPASGPAAPARDLLAVAREAMAAVRGLPVSDYAAHLQDATAWEDRAPLTSFLSAETNARGMAAIKDEVT